MIHVNEMAELMNDHIVNDFKGRHRKTVIEGEMFRRAAHFVRDSSMVKDLGETFSASDRS